MDSGLEGLLGGGEGSDRVGGGPGHTRLGMCRGFSWGRGGRVGDDGTRCGNELEMLDTVVAVRPLAELLMLAVLPALEVPLKTLGGGMP